jgi:hypothetical protein
MHKVNIVSEKEARSEKEITTYLDSLPKRTRADMETLHNHIMALMPECELWFLDGKDGTGKIVSNPSIGYGIQKLTYANGRTKDFYQIGISANTSGISVYIMGLTDKTYLPNHYAQDLQKASVTSYCIKFKKLLDLDFNTLERAITDGIKQTSD